MAWLIESGDGARDLVLVAGDEIGHKGFAYAGIRVQAVECACQSAATSAGHVCLEAQDLLAQPVGFATAVVRNRRVASCWTAAEG